MQLYIGKLQVHDTLSQITKLSAEIIDKFRPTKLNDLKKLRISLHDLEFTVK